MKKINCAVIGMGIGERHARFYQEFNYNVQSDKFSMNQYEDNITNNLNNKISNDIIFLLGTLK